MCGLRWERREQKFRHSSAVISISWYKDGSWTTRIYDGKKMESVADSIETVFGPKFVDINY
jgi:hypothetical protein